MLTIHGTTQPSADTLMELCSYYQIDNILEAFGYEIVIEHQRLPILLSEEEKQIINAYRSKPSMQEAVKKLLEIE